MTSAVAYVDRERLGGAVRTITDRFGGAVLLDARRTRNLLLDEYGPSGVSQRADIDRFVDAISVDFAELTVTGPADDAASRLAGRTTMTDDDARFTVDLVRRVTRRTVDGGPVAGTPLPPPDLGPGGVVLADSSADPRPGGRDPRRSSRLVPVLAASTAIALLAAIAILAISAGRVSDARDEAQAARHELTQAVAVATDSSRPADQGDATRDSRLLDEKAALESDVTELRSRVAELEAAGEEARTSLAGIRAAFGLGPTQIPASSSIFAGDGGEVECVGIRDDACPDTWYLSGRIVSEGGQTYFDSSGVAKIPIASLDGLNWSGEGAVTEQYGHRCDDQPKPTTMRIALTPAQLVADPATRSITVTAYVATWTFSTQPALGCGAASETYTATLFAA